MQKLNKIKDVASCLMPDVVVNVYDNWLFIHTQFVLSL